MSEAKIIPITQAPSLRDRVSPIRAAAPQSLDAWRWPDKAGPVPMGMGSASGSQDTLIASRASPYGSDAGYLCPLCEHMITWMWHLPRLPDAQVARCFHPDNKLHQDGAG